MLKPIFFASALLSFATISAGAATFSFDYEATSPPFGVQSVIGRFATNGAGMVTSLSGTLDGFDITALQSGTYNPLSEDLDLLFQVGSPNYELKALNGLASVTAENSSVGTITIDAVTAVPLPASAPMFGAALVALGALGYGMKRKGKVAIRSRRI